MAEIRIDHVDTDEGESGGCCGGNGAESEKLEHFVDSIAESMLVISAGVFGQ